MPILAILFLGAMFAGVVYSRDDRPEVVRYAKMGVVAGAIGITLVAMSVMGPMAALIMFALFVVSSFLSKFWS